MVGDVNTLSILVFYLHISRKIMIENENNTQYKNGSYFLILVYWIWVEILHNKCPGSAQHDLMKKGNFTSRFFLSIYIK